MKISLINPPFIFPSKYEIIISQCLGLRSISSYLKLNQSHQIEFIDALMIGSKKVKRYANGYISGLGTDEIIDLIPKDTELIGISAPFSQLAPVVHDIVGKTKTTFPHATIVMGGVYPSTQPQLALTSSADYIIIGEGEHAFKLIADGKSVYEIPGVFSSNFQNSSKFCPVPLIDDLDTLPYPDYSIPYMDKYFNLSPRMRYGRTATLVTSRGCPFSCNFCSIHPVYGHKYRYRSAKNVIDEIEYLIKTFSIRTLEIEDDNFTLIKNRTIEILEGLIVLNEKGAGLNWRTPNGVKIDTLDEDIIRLIKRSNCTELVLALEHGDPEMLKIMNKKLDLDAVFQVIELLVKYGIKVTIFIIVGYPGETNDRFNNSIKYLKKLKSLNGNIFVHPNIAQPYPGTNLFLKCIEENYIKDINCGNFLVRKDLMSTMHTVSITTPDFNAIEVIHRKNIILKLFNPKWMIFLRKCLPYLPTWLNKIFRKIRGTS